MTDIFKQKLFSFITSQFGFTPLLSDMDELLHVVAEEHYDEVMNIVANNVHQTAKSKGWWNDRRDIVTACAAVSPELAKAAQNAIDAQALALIHSETSEALEGSRGNLMDDKVPQYTMMEAELADVIIRIMDFAAGRNLRVFEAMKAKAEYNKTRAYKHGKAF